MADVLDKLTAAPRTFMYQGQRYELSPLSITDVTQMKAFIKRYIMRQAQAQVAMMLEVSAPPELIAEVWRDAAQTCKKPLEADCMQDAECALEFMYMSLRKRQPTITVQQVAVMLEDTDVQAELLRETSELNSVEREIKN